MKIEINRRDAVHLLNWLNHYAGTLPQTGFGYLEPDVRKLAARLAEQFNLNGLSVRRNGTVPCWNWKNLPDNWFLIDA